MRNWKNWLAPILTCLTVLALALLPPRLSNFRDGELTGTVHAEELAEDSNFPAKPPTLPQRIRLLVQFTEQPDTLTIIGQELSGPAHEEAVELARRELAVLTDTGGLPKELDASRAELFADKLYLRNQTDLSSASFLNLGGYKKPSGEYHSIVLDGESGQLLSLEVSSDWILKADMNLAEIGAAFLDRLGLESQLVVHDSSFSAGFRLKDVPVMYWVTWLRGTLSIQPQLDWEALDTSGGSDKERTVSAAASVSDAG